MWGVNIVNALLGSLMFSLSKEQREKVDAWLKEIEPNGPGYQGCIGGAITYSFTPTFIGVVVKVSHYKGHEIDVSDYEDW